MKQRWVVSSLYFSTNRNSYFMYKENLGRNRVLLTFPLSHGCGLAQQFYFAENFLGILHPLKVITEESCQKFIGLSCTLNLSRVSITQVPDGPNARNYGFYKVKNGMLGSFPITEAKPESTIGITSPLLPHQTFIWRKLGGVGELLFCVSFME